VGRIGGTTSTGAPDDDVVWAYLCRKYDGIVQLIGHDTVTGATCFFESEGGADVVDSLSIQDGLVVGPVPGPDHAGYEAVLVPASTTESGSIVTSPSSSIVTS
jgi:hypothetical protein